MAPVYALRNRVRNRIDRFGLAFVALAGLALVVLLIAGHGITFVADEWAFINERQSWDLATFMRPHNEHWSAVPLLIYKTLLATVGLRSYLPYQLVVIGLHIATATALYQLVRGEAGKVLAVMAGVLFLFLGAAGRT